jgi:serine/threonine protein kinase
VSTASSSDEESLPARIDQYEIVDLVGEGGMGRVDRTRDTRLGRTVAIKIVSPTLAVDPDRLYRFEQEARSTAALNHPVAWRSRCGAGQSPRGAHFHTAAGDHYQRRVLLN